MRNTKRSLSLERLEARSMMAANSLAASDNQTPDFEGSFLESEKWHDWFSVGDQIPGTGDFDGDGIDDVVTFSRGGNVYVSISDGTQFLGTGRIWRTGFAIDSLKPLVGDFNGDGKDDIARASSNELYVALSNGQGFNTATKWLGRSPEYNETIVGDFDGDGSDDVAFLNRNSQGRLQVALSKGNGFEAAETWSNDFRAYSKTLAGDFDGDGDDDVATFVRDSDMSKRGDVYVRLSTGTGFGPADKWHNWFSIADEIPLVDDFNGDGKEDVVTFTRGTSGDVYVALSDGEQFLGTARKWHDHFNLGTKIPGVGDFNGDGKADAATFARHSTRGIEGNVYVILSDAVPALHSNLGATHTLYLDFNGIKAANLLAMDFDGRPSHFNAFERNLIRDVHARVSEDFAPFDIDVTTVDPRKSGNADLSRIRVTAIGDRLGGNPEDAGCHGCIRGVPVVWSGRIGAKGGHLASTVSHETGHGLGLHHQSDYDNNGKRIRDYSIGGSDWTPLMGASARDRSVWYAGRNVFGNYQNDFAVIASKLGYRRDDHAAGPWSATSLGSTFDFRTETGIIERTSDSDSFFFAHPGGPVKIEVEVVDSIFATHGEAANLDAKLELLHWSGGTLLHSSAPLDRLGASITTWLAPGNYLATVSGDQHSTGSVGQYKISSERLSVSFPELSQQLGFHSSGNWHLDWLYKEKGVDSFRNEKWVQGKNDEWYFITPDGTLRSWSRENPTSSSFIASLEPAVYDRLGAEFSQLHSEYGFRFAGSWYQDWWHREKGVDSFRNEKWFVGHSGEWYFITPDGTLRGWSKENPDVSWFVTKFEPYVYQVVNVLEMTA